MSYLDKFCILHFEENNEFICVTKKELLLNKAHFAVNGYGMDEETYPKNTNKAASMSGKDKKKADEVMKDDLSNEDPEEEEDAIALNDNIVILESSI